MMGGDIEVSDFDRSMKLDGKAVTLGDDGGILVGGMAPRAWHVRAVARMHPDKDFRQAAQCTPRFEALKTEERKAKLKLSRRPW